MRVYSIKEAAMISIVVPCYNEQDTILIFYNKIVCVLNEIQCQYEIIFVNDGSRDRTLDLLRDITSKDQYVTYLSFSRNFGKEAAMYAGLLHTRGDYVAVMDADLQDPPSLLPQMFTILRKGNYDSVAARRDTREGEPKIRSFFARSFYKLINLISDAEIVDGARDFRLMTRPVVDAILSVKEHNRFSKGIFGWVGFRTYWLSYHNVERVAGDTKWSFWKLFRYAIDGIINFSEVPLALASWLGLFMTIISLGAVAFIVLRRLLVEEPVAGWASTVCIIVFIGGLQLFCLGIIGKYIAKIYTEIKGRPHYIVEESNIVEDKYT